MSGAFVCENCDTEINIEHPRKGDRLECPICFEQLTIVEISPPTLKLKDAMPAEEITVDEISGETKTPVVEEITADEIARETKKPVVKAKPRAYKNARYKCLPFICSTKLGDQSPGMTLATQLEEMLNDSDRAGWEFYRIDTVRVYIDPGCLGMIIGKRTEQIEYDIVIFQHKPLPAK